MLTAQDYHWRPPDLLCSCKHVQGSLKKYNKADLKSVWAPSPRGGVGSLSWVFLILLPRWRFGEPVLSSWTRQVAPQQGPERETSFRSFSLGGKERREFRPKRWTWKVPDANKECKDGYCGPTTKIWQSSYSSIQQAEVDAIITVLSDIVIPINIISDSQYAVKEVWQKILWKEDREWKLDIMLKQGRGYALTLIEENEHRWILRRRIWYWKEKNMIWYRPTLQTSDACHAAPYVRTWACQDQANVNCHNTHLGAEKLSQEAESLVHHHGLSKTSANLLLAMVTLITMSVSVQADPVIIIGHIFSILLY